MALLFAVQAAVGFLNVRVRLTRDYEILEVHLKEYARVFLQSFLLSPTFVTLNDSPDEVISDCVVPDPSCGTDGVD